MEDRFEKINSIEEFINMMKGESKEDLICEKEKEVALELLNTLTKAEIPVIRATNILNFCLMAIKFSKVEI